MTPGFETVSVMLRCSACSTAWTNMPTALSISLLSTLNYQVSLRTCASVCISLSNSVRRATGVETGSERPGSERSATGGARGPST
jgi:hypothetical protein